MGVVVLGYRDSHTNMWSPWYEWSGCYYFWSSCDAVGYSGLQCVATHCNTLQHTATHCITLDFVELVLLSCMEFVTRIDVAVLGDMDSHTYMWSPWYWYFECVVWLFGVRDSIFLEFVLLNCMEIVTRMDVYWGTWTHTCLCSVCCIHIQAFRETKFCV